MRRVLFLVIVSAIAFGLPVYAGSDQEVAEQVIAITKAQWAAEIGGKIGSRLEIAADEYTEFSPTAPVRIDGKALNRDFAEAFANGGGKMLAGDMVNPKVQVHGDVAILSYNFVGVSKRARMVR